jgi:hypothetical protein
MQHGHNRNPSIIASTSLPETKRRNKVHKVLKSLHFYHQPRSLSSIISPASTMTKKSIIIIAIPGLMPNLFCITAATISLPAVEPLNLKTMPSPIPSSAAPSNIKNRKSSCRSFKIVSVF